MSGNAPSFDTFVQGDIIEIADVASAATAIGRKGSSAWQ